MVLTIAVVKSVLLARQLIRSFAQTVGKAKAPCMAVHPALVYNICLNDVWPVSFARPGDMNLPVISTNAGCCELHLAELSTTLYCLLHPCFASDEQGSQVAQRKSIVS